MENATSSSHRPVPPTSCVHTYCTSKRPTPPLGSRRGYMRPRRHMPERKGGNKLVKVDSSRKYQRSVASNICHIKHPTWSPGKALLRCKIQAQWLSHRCSEHSRSQNTLGRNVHYLWWNRFWVISHASWVIRGPGSSVKNVWNCPLSSSLSWSRELPFVTELHSSLEKTLIKKNIFFNISAFLSV